MALTSEFTAAQAREYHSTFDTTLTKEETHRRELRNVERLIQEETARGGTYIFTVLNNTEVKETLTRAGYTLSSNERGIFVKW